MEEFGIAAADRGLPATAPGAKIRKRRMARGKSPDTKAPDYDADPTLRVVWVFENLGRKDVDYDHAPGSGAIGWLEFLKGDDKARADFYKTAPLKMMPAKTQVAAGSGAADDARTIFECISAARSSQQAPVPKPSPEGVDGKPGVPGDVGAGGEHKP